MSSEAKMDVEGEGVLDEGVGAAALQMDAQLSWGLRLASAVFKLQRGDTSQREFVMNTIATKSMAPYYTHVCSLTGTPVDESLLAQLRAANAEELQKLDAAIEEAKEHHGESEVLDAMVAKARFFWRIGEKDKCIETYDGIPGKAMSTGQRIDHSLSIIRLGFFLGDTSLVHQQIEKAKILNEEGGDWDRRNRLHVYEGMYSILMRDFDKAAELLLQSLATFTAVEIFDYSTFVFYAVLCGIKSLSRTDLHRRVILSPDVLSVIRDMPALSNLLNGLYDCQYRRFLLALVDLEPSISSDMFLSQHSRYLIREFRIMAYSQFLESYRSVTTESMASSFGVSPKFLDSELSRMIASRRVNAKINKIDGIIETNRPDSKSLHYQSIIKHGDALLTRIQRLSRVVSV